MSETRKVMRFEGRDYVEVPDSRVERVYSCEVCSLRMTNCSVVARAARKAFGNDCGKRAVFYALANEEIAE